MIHKLITLKAIAGKEAELNELVQSLIEPSRAEDGCVKYDAYVECAASGTIHLIESWETSANLEAHKTTEHFLKFKELGPAMIAEKGGISLDRL